jgi:hypothetical protein
MFIKIALILLYLFLFFASTLSFKTDAATILKSLTEEQKLYTASNSTETKMTFSLWVEIESFSYLDLEIQK